MKPKFRALLAVAIVVALGLAGGVAAQPLLGLLGALPGATATGYNAHNPNIRGADGKLVPSKLTTDPQMAEITIDDGTGVTLTTPTNAVIKDAALTLCSNVRGSVVCDPANGTITVKTSGLYRLTFCAGDGTGGNTDVQTIKVFENDDGGGAAAVSPAILAATTTLTAQPWVPLCSSGTVNITNDKALGTGNVVFDARATASGGNMTLKRFRFSVAKVDENDPPSP